MCENNFEKYLNVKYEFSGGRVNVFYGLCWEKLSAKLTILYLVCELALGKGGISEYRWPVISFEWLMQMRFLK